MKMNHSSGEAGSDGVMANDKSTPKDAQVMVSILKDLGIMEYEPRVLNQLLEFAYRYMTTILDDAKMVSSHAKKKAVDVDDIKLAVQMYAEESLTSPPGRDVLLETARIRNALPLPLPKPTCGLRLPPERFCITASNYRLGKLAKKKNIAAGKGTFTNQTTPKVLVAPAGSTLIQPVTGFGAQQQKIKLDTTSTMPNIQIQSGTGVGGQPMFSLTVNPPPMQTGVKRKASDMDFGDQ